MSQRSFVIAQFALKKKRSRCEKVLADMQRVVPWARLIVVVKPLCMSGGHVGRRPFNVTKTQRMYLLQLWYGLADESIEDSVYDFQGFRDFVGIYLYREPVPDATTLLKFRHLLVTNDLTRALFEEINAHLGEQGLLMRAGTIVDDIIITAPISTKKISGERDPEMVSGDGALPRAAKKGNQWHDSMKPHIGMDAESGTVKSLVSAAANVNDVTQAGELLSGEEINALQSGKHQQLRAGPLGQMRETAEKIKASVRAKVKHPSHVIKDLFRHRKTHYRELEKNHAQMFSLRGLANLVIAEGQWLAIHGGGAS